jgi:RNA polymerase sigma-70 factor (ECF subfamily)
MPEDARYERAAVAYGPALSRLARAYEAHPERRRDLLQDIHLALWQSFARYDGRCSVRTWVYRVAHNVGASHVLRARRAKTQDLVSLDVLETMPLEDYAEGVSDRRLAAERLVRLIHRLEPLERQVLVLYLEEIDAASIAEITGLTSRSVATRIHRVKALLAKWFCEGGAR